MVSATLENYLCWHHSAEAAFEPQVEKPEDVLANFGSSAGVLAAPGAPENGAPAYAPASFARNPGCRLRAVGSCTKSIAKHSPKWRVRGNRRSRLRRAPTFADSRTSQIEVPTGAPVYAPREVGPKPRLPSTRKHDSVLPSTRRGGVWKNDAMSRILGLVLEAPEPPRAALKMPQHEPQDPESS